MRPSEQALLDITVLTDAKGQKVLFKITWVAPSVGEFSTNDVPPEELIPELAKLIVGKKLIKSVTQQEHSK
jgi:hypothetical protein